MIIELKGVSKRFTHNWIIKNMSYQFQSDTTYAIRGFNGSGKSTLLKILSGLLSPSKGRVSYSLDDEIINRSDIYKYISFAGPYVSTPHQLSIHEAVRFHFTFKSFVDGMSTSAFYDCLDIAVNQSSRLSELSSGQLQRLLLAMAILSDTQILLLDEPGSYLDINAKTWLQNLIKDYSDNRVVIIASNDPEDLIACSETIHIADYH